MRKRYRDLMTDEGSALSGTPWQEYPRPRMKRESYYNLNGEWDFAVTAANNIPEEFRLKIRVPFPPESILSGQHRLKGRFQNLYYRRKFILPKGFIEGRVILHFGAIDQYAEVWLNGASVAKHQGGYLPFSVDITKNLLSDGENILIVMAKDSMNHDLPYGKQKIRRGGMWYTPVSGIWQTVWLESVPDIYIKELKITPTLESVTISVEIENGLVKDGRIYENQAYSIKKTITVDTGDGSNIIKEFTGDEITIEIDKPRLWSPEEPFLYNFEISAGEDMVSSYFALRTVSVRNVDGISRLCLNDRPYFFHGLLDQGYFSDGIYLPASEKGFYRDISSMKELGFNTLRKHLKIEPQCYYYYCDKLGMIVLQDMVNNGNYSFFRDTVLPTLGLIKEKETFLAFLVKRDDRKFIRKKAVKENFTEAMKETARYLYNFPCICGWTIFNEGWGQFESDRLYDILKQIDRTRFIDSTSGWFWQKKSDVSSIHVYFHPIVVKPDSRPVFVSEFGGYSLKIPGNSYNIKKTYGYRYFEDSEKFQRELTKLYEKEIIAQMDKGLCGSIYTQLSDVEDETNGMLTFDRKVLKADVHEMQRIASRLRFTDSN